MLRRIHWMGVTLGVVVTLLLVLLFEVLIIPPVDSYLYDAFAVERPGGAVSFTGSAWNTYMILSTSLMLVALPLAFFIGGVLISLIARSNSGLNGVASAIILIVIGFVWLISTFLPGFLDPISNPGEVYTRSENLQMFLIWAVAFCCISPFVVIAGYLGGRLGSRFRPSRT